MNKAFLSSILFSTVLTLTSPAHAGIGLGMETKASSLETSTTFPTQHPLYLGAPSFGSGTTKPNSYGTVEIDATFTEPFKALVDYNAVPSSTHTIWNDVWNSMVNIFSPEAQNPTSKTNNSNSFDDFVSFDLNDYTASAPLLSAIQAINWEKFSLEQDSVVEVLKASELFFSYIFATDTEYIYEDAQSVYYEGNARDILFAILDKPYHTLKEKVNHISDYLYAVIEDAEAMLDDVSLADLIPAVLGTEEMDYASKFSLLSNLIHA